MDGVATTTGIIVVIITTGRFTTPIIIITTITLLQEIHRTMIIQGEDPEVLHPLLQEVFQDGNQQVQILQE